MSVVTTYYLEMHSPDAIVPGGSGAGLALRECRVKQYQYNRFLYQLVGSQWGWLDKLAWSEAQWQEYAESPDLRTWVAYSEGSPAGYFELQRQGEDQVEVCYFGLAGKFIGRGHGGYLLTQALEQAWAWGPVKRVWVHTCTLDHPGALHNYQARGMTLYNTEEEDSG